MHLFLAFIAQMLVKPVFRWEYHFAMPATRLIADVFLRMSDETRYRGK